MVCTKFKYSLLLIVLIMAMVFTMACGNSSEGEFTPRLYYTVAGEVVNTSGAALQNARVEVTDYTMTKSNESKPAGYFGTLTDEDGAFTLKVESFNRLDKVSLEISRNGYVANQMDVGVMEGSTVKIKVKLSPQAAFDTIDATIDNTITKGKASVTISANTLVNEAGAAVSGAQVSLTSIDTTANLDLLPGDLYYKDGDSLKLFSTYGMIEILVQDGQKDPLNLASGATASISIPVGEVVGANPPSSVSLLYYNEEDPEIKAWELAGDLTLNAAKTAYTGTVSHFSKYSAGISFDPTYIKGSVIDQAGNDLYGAEVSIFTKVFSNAGVWQAKYVTGPEGNFPSIMSTDLSNIVPKDMAGYLPVPANTELIVYIKYVKPDDDENPDNNEVFTFRSGQPAPAAGVEDTRKPWELPFVSGEAGAKAIYADEPVLIELASDATISGTIFFDNEEPGDNLWVVFQEYGKTDYTGMIFAGVDNETGNLVATDASYANTDETEIALKAETKYNAYIVVRYTAPRLETISWFTSVGPPYALEDSDGVDADGVTLVNTKVFTTQVAGENTIFTITLPTPSSGGPVVVPDSYVKGTAYLEDGTLAPPGSWIIFTGNVLGSPVTIRAQVGANGLFPDPNSNFDEALDPTKEFLVLPAGQKWTVTIAEYEKNPLNPEILFTFDYTSPGEDEEANVVISAKARVKGYVWNENTGAPYGDVMVKFEETDPAENEDTEEEGDYLDPHIVIVYTDANGNYPPLPYTGAPEPAPVSLNLNTRYKVTVSQYQTVGPEKLPIDPPIASVFHVTGNDGTVVQLDIPPRPPKVNGTVKYDDGTAAANLTVYFILDGVFDQTTPSATTGANGTYSIDLTANGTYSVQVWNTVGGFSQLYPASGGIDYTAGDAASVATLDINMTGVAAP